MQRYIQVAPGRNGIIRPCTWMNTVQFIAYQQDPNDQFYVCSHCGEDAKRLGITIVSTVPASYAGQTCRFRHENSLRCLGICQRNN